MQKLRKSFASFVLISACLCSAQAFAQGYYVDQPNAEETYYEGQGYYVEQPNAQESQGAYYDEQGNYVEQIPAQGAYYDQQGNYVEQIPAQGAYYDQQGNYVEQIPAQGAYYDQQGNYVEGAYYDQQGNYVEGAYYDQQGNYVEGAYYDQQGNYVEGAYYDQQGNYVEGAYYDQQGNYVEGAPTDQNAEPAEEEVEHALPLSGINIRASIAAPITASFGTAFFLGEDHSFSGPGFGFSLQAIYRTGKVGFGIEQKLHGIIVDIPLENGNGENEGTYTDPNQETPTKTETFFMGSTLLLLKEYIKAGQNGLFTFGQGIGLAYGSNTPGKKIFATDGDWAFAFKLELGYSYFIHGKYGIGFNLEYLLGVHASKSYPNIGMSFTNAFVPMLTYEMLF